MNLLQLSDLPEVDCLIITQSLDDHCHLKTLRPFNAKYPSLRAVATPNAQANLDPIFSKLSFSNPDKQRRQEKCPLTPEEVGRMLSAHGYNCDVHIYVAYGELERSMAENRLCGRFGWIQATLLVRVTIRPSLLFQVTIQLAKNQNLVL